MIEVTRYEVVFDNGPLKVGDFVWGLSVGNEVILLDEDLRGIRTKGYNLVSSNSRYTTKLLRERYNVIIEFCMFKGDKFLKLIPEYINHLKALDYYEEL